MKLNVKMFTRFFVLAMFLGCLGFILFSPVTQEAFARPCCQSCPGWDGDDNCGIQCGGWEVVDNTKAGQRCYQACVQQSMNCLSVCMVCGSGGGGGGGTYCQVNSDCPPSSDNPFPQCVGWNCVY